MLVKGLTIQILHISLCTMNGVKTKVIKQGKNKRRLTFGMTINLRFIHLIIEITLFQHVVIVAEEETLCNYQKLTHIFIN